LLSLIDVVIRKVQNYQSVDFKIIFGWDKAGDNDGTFCLSLIISYLHKVVCCQLVKLKLLVPHYQSCVRSC